MSKCISRAKFKRLAAIARACSDHQTVDELDRLAVRGKATQAVVRRISLRCSDPVTTDALDALADHGLKARA